MGHDGADRSPLFGTVGQLLIFDRVPDEPVPVGTLSVSDREVFKKFIGECMTVKQAAKAAGFDWKVVNRTLDDIDFRTDVVEVSIRASAARKERSL